MVDMTSGRERPLVDDQPMLSSELLACALSCACDEVPSALELQLRRRFFVLLTNHALLDQAIKQRIDRSAADFPIRKMHEFRTVQT